MAAKNARWVDEVMPLPELLGMKRLERLAPKHDIKVDPVRLFCCPTPKKNETDRLRAEKKDVCAVGMSDVLFIGTDILLQLFSPRPHRSLCRL